MDRRTFLMGSAAAAFKPRSRPSLAITIDDVAWRRIPEKWRTLSADALFKALDKHGVKAMLFVAGANVDDAQGKALLERWNAEGHLLANHTYEHQRLGRDGAVMPWYGEDILRCGRLLAGYSGFRKLFRFPTLHEGETAKQRDGVRAFLHKHGYRNGHVTIDTSDWYYDARLRQRLDADAGFDPDRYREPYIEHLLDRASHYDEVGRAVLGRTIPHTLLIHYNLCAVLFLDALLTACRQGGWDLVDPEEAFADPVYRSEPDVLPAGQSLLWMLAKETGRYKGQLEYPGEWESREKPKLDALGL